MEVEQVSGDRSQNGDYSALFARFADITSRYASADPGTRIKIERGLVRIANEDEPLDEGPSLQLSKAHEEIRADYQPIAKSFNGKEARRFREGLGLSRQTVGARCCVNPQTIGHYEETPMPRRATENVVSYLAWLKSKGFDLGG